MPAFSQPGLGLTLILFCCLPPILRFSGSIACGAGFLVDLLVDLRVEEDLCFLSLEPDSKTRGLELTVDFSLTERGAAANTGGEEALISAARRISRFRR